MSVAPAIAVTCDVTGCDRAAVVTDEHAASYETARAWARSWGWTSPGESDWCPDHSGQYGGDGFPRSFEHLSEPTDRP